MLKYYVLSGHCRLLTWAIDPLSAAKNLISRLNPDEDRVGSFVYVSEWGFGDYEGMDPEGFLFLTEVVEASLFAA